MNTINSQKYCTKIHNLVKSILPECLAILVGAGIKVNVRDEKGITPLLLAAQQGHDQCLDILVKSGADVNRPLKGFTPLHLAAMYGHNICVEQLITEGVDVEEISQSYRFTPLQLAVRNGCKICTKLLVQAGAGVNEKIRMDHFCSQPSRRISSLC